MHLTATNLMGIKLYVLVTRQHQNLPLTTPAEQRVTSGPGPLLFPKQISFLASDRTRCAVGALIFPPFPSRPIPYYSVREHTPPSPAPLPLSSGSHGGRSRWGRGYRPLPVYTSDLGLTGVMPCLGLMPFGSRSPVLLGRIRCALAVLFVAMLL